MTEFTMENSTQHPRSQERRPSWQQYARQRRQNMSDEQRQQYLARRRASYQERIRRGKQVVVTDQPTNQTTPLQDITNASRVIRLSTIRQMARNTYHPHFVPGHGTHDNEAGPSDRRDETGTRDTVADIMTR
ncbi:hypothetical protein PIB30_012283 [Stylosanthes scabra]|uniref:Uncharacterized protein n=1 Tax=Stylosanthes scabra TaxID=79078 RepID=A0ABU6X7X8_9FABA|nr:hypothetical protein [Stylosanthes scabra]